MSHRCIVCKNPITDKVYEYSINRGSKALCIQHQNNSSSGFLKQSFPSNYYNKRQNAFQGYSKQSTKCSICKREKGEPTPESKKLGQLLKGMGWKVEFEKCDRYKHIDIAIVEAKVNLEVDGVQHNLEVNQALVDLQRTFYSFRKGYATLRIPNCLMRNEETIHKTAQFVDAFLNKNVETLSKEGEETELNGLLLGFGNVILKKLFR